MPYTGTRSYVVGAKATTGTAMTSLTAVDSNLSADATAIIAYWCAAGMAAETTVEANASQVQFLLGGQTQIGPFSTQPFTGNGAATNESGVARIPDVWPVAVPTNVTAGALGGMAVAASGKNSALGSPTNTQSMVAGLVTWEGPLPSKDILDALRFGFVTNSPLPFRNGANSAATATVTANATALPAVTAASDANVLVGLSSAWTVDGALTAGSEVVGWIDWTATISGFGFQRIPMAAMDASLGTAVGPPTNPPQVFFPTYIPVTSPGGNRSPLVLTPTVRLNATIDTASVEANAFWV